MNIIEQ